MERIGRSRVRGGGRGGGGECLCEGRKGDLTALGEEIDDGVNLAAAVDVLELCGAAEGKVVHSESPLAPAVGVQQGRLRREGGVKQ